MKNTGKLAVVFLAMAGFAVDGAFGRGGGGGGGRGGMTGGRGGNTGGFNGNNNNGNYNNNNGNNPNANNQQNQPNTASNAPAVIAARKELAAAQTEAEKAESNLTTITVNLKSAFETSPEFTAAMAAQTQAQGEYDAAVATAKSKLTDNAGYQDSLKRKAKAEKEIDAMHQRGEAPEDVLKVTQQALTAGAEAHRLESEVTSADPKVTSSKAKLVETAGVLSAMRKEFEKSARQNTVWQTAKATLDTARANQQKAQLALNNLLNGGLPPAKPEEKASAN